MEEKKKLKKHLEDKKKEKRQKEKHELKGIKREADAWKFINKKRKKKRMDRKQCIDKRLKKLFQELSGRK